MLCVGAPMQGHIKAHAVVRTIALHRDNRYRKRRLALLGEILMGLCCWGCRLARGRCDLSWA